MKGKGKVAIQAGPEIIEYKEYDLPTPEKGAVLLKILKTNVCGSDIHTWEGKHPMKNCVLGHELMGEIIELGEGVTVDYAGNPIKVGDRVSPVYYLTCQRCKACMEGNFNICENGYSVWRKHPDIWPHFVGGYATHYYISPNQYFYKLPDNVTDYMAAGANCGLSQMVYSVDKINLRIGETVLILGSGGLGLYASAISKEKGAKVIVFDAIQSRLDDAKKFGADHVVNITGMTLNDKIAKIYEINNGRDPEVVIDVTGSPKALDDAIRLASLGGRILEVGSVTIEESANASILPGLITRKCLTVFGVLKYQPWYLYKALQFLSRNADKYPLGQMSDRDYSLEEAEEALKNSRSRKVVRAVLVPNK